MSLRLRIGVTVAVALTGLAVTLSVIVWAYSVKAIAEAEVLEAQEDMLRAENTLANSLTDLQTFVEDWAYWDDTHTFVAEQNADYVEENLGAYVFEAFDFDALVLTDLSDTPVYAERYAPTLEDAVPLDRLTLDKLLAQAATLGNTSEAGYSLLPEGPAQVVFAPVSREVGGDVNGAFLAVRYLDDAFLTWLAQSTLVALELVPGEGVRDAPPEVTDAEVRLSTDLPTFSGEALGLVVRHPRTFYRQGVRGASALIALLSTVSIVFGVLTLVFVERLLLSRLVRLSRWVAHVGKTGNLDKRVGIVGVDEIAQLGMHINGLLEALQRSFRDLNESRERYSLVAEGVNDGLWDWNLTTGEVLYSTRWFSLLGYDCADEVGTVETWRSKVHPDDLARVQDKLEQHLAGATEYFEDEHRLKTRDGDYLWMLVRGKSVRGAAGEPERLAGSLTNISVRGIFDPLTGLPNRQMLQERLANLLERHDRFGGVEASLLFMDVNRFKFINDSLGHKTGDLLLLELAARLQACVRGDDLVARLGGDEFVVLLVDTPVEGVGTVLERIEKRVARRFELGGETLFTSLSIGVIGDVTAHKDVSTVLERADAAMYEAKRSGAPHLYYDEQMLAEAIATHRLETELRDALAKGEFYLLYQPIVALEDGRVSGVEALLRWRHPGRDFVSPAEFIPVAESSGLIVPMGLWVLEEACATLAAHPELGPSFTMSVNLSAKQLGRADLVEDVKTVLRKTGANPQQLKLEITETAVIDSTENVLGALGELRALGVRIVMDDFGTGYSSLTYIQELPIDTLKVDRAFIQKMQEDARTLEIVGTIVALAEALSLDLVAEGIETPQELATLRGLNCPYGQGYYFAKPTTMPEVVALGHSVQPLEAEESLERMSV